MLLSGMLSLHRCSAKTWKLVQRFEMAGACRWGDVTATSEAREGRSSGLNLVEVVEPAAAVETGGLI
jgi:hypothetical protein